MDDLDDIAIGDRRGCNGGAPDDCTIQFDHDAARVELERHKKFCDGVSVDDGARIAVDGQLHIVILSGAAGAAGAGRGVAGPPLCVDLMAMFLGTQVLRLRARCAHAARALRSG